MPLPQPNGPNPCHSVAAGLQAGGHGGVRDEPDDLPGLAQPDDAQAHLLPEVHHHDNDHDDHNHDHDHRPTNHNQDEEITTDLRQQQLKPFFSSFATTWLYVTLD